MLTLHTKNGLVCSVHGLAVYLARYLSLTCTAFKPKLRYALSVIAPRGATMAATATTPYNPSIFAAFAARGCGHSQNLRYPMWHVRSGGACGFNLPAQSAKTLTATAAPSHRDWIFFSKPTTLVDPNLIEYTKKKKKKKKCLYKGYVKGCLHIIKSKLHRP